MYTRPSIAYCKEVGFEIVLVVLRYVQEMELKDSGMEKVYSNYLREYGTMLKEGATTDCLHPGDLPTVNLLVEIIVRACSYPVSGHGWLATQYSGW